MCRKQEKALPIWQGVVFLSIASLFTKILSAFYRVPFQNMAGDLGFYVYQQVYPLYGIVVTLAMYGFPVVLSKQRATLLSEGRMTEARQVTSVFFYGLLLLSGLIWCILYAFASAIAVVMGDPLLEGPIRAMSFVLLLLPFLSIGRGYHQGNGELVSTAFSHVFEQLVRVLLILGFTFFSLKVGLDVYHIGSGAAYGSFFGGLSGVVVLVVITKGAWLRQLIAPWKLRTDQMLKSYANLFSQSGFICLSALVLILFQLIDSFSVVRLLEWNGLEMTEAFMMKGIYDRGQPLIQLGTVLTTTFSLALVPMLSKATAMGENEVRKHYQHLSYRIAFVVGGAATVGLIIITMPTNQMLFKDVAGSNVLQMLALIICLNSFFVTLSAILQGYHFVQFPARAALYGLIIKGIGNLFLIPLFGTVGAALSTIIAFLLMVVYLLFVLQQYKQLYFGELKPYLYIFFMLFLMGTLTKLWQTGVTYFFPEPTRAEAAFISLTSVGVGGICVFLCLFVFPIFSKKEWEHIPVLGRLYKRVRSGR